MATTTIKIPTPESIAKPGKESASGKLGDPEVERIMRRFDSLKSKKRPWLENYQLLGEFIHSRKQEFTSAHEAGEFLNRELFDSTGPKSAKTAASSLVSHLWPQGTKKRLVLEMPRSLKNTKSDETKTYYEFVSEVILDVMDDPKAGFANAFLEYMLDEIVFGTAGIEAEPHPETKVNYTPWDVKSMHIAQGRNSLVDTVYIAVQRTVHEMVAEYKIENVSKETREAFEDLRHNDKVDLLIAIEPRMSPTFNKRGKEAMPFQSKHIEIKNKHMVRESGFNEMPIKVGRFSKLAKEVYGRSPGMDALPDILESNAIWEAVTIAIEKTLDPPLGVLDDGKLGGGEIDTSAGAINVFNLSGRAGEKNPIFPLFTVGEIKQVVNLLDKLGESIGDHFFIDKLLDFNNETRMTLGETQIRNRLRNAALGSVYTRQISEVIQPIIERTFNILLAGGHLGVIKGSVDADIAELLGETPVIIPDEVAQLMLKGEDVYKIEFFTPAMRIMQAEEAEGIFRLYEMAQQIANTGDQSVLDSLDADIAISLFAELVGAPSEMMRSGEEIALIREDRAEALEKQQQFDAAQQASEAARNIGQSGLVPTSAPAPAAA